MVERALNSATLIEEFHLASDTKHLLFAPEPGPLTFAPGQFVSVRQKNDQDKEITRAYSIASSPKEDGSFELCLNRVIDGFMSNRLCDLVVGDKIRWHGPHGLFTLRNPLCDSLMIATGTGIAPFRSMLHWLFQDPTRHGGNQIWLIYGTRYPDHIFYQHEFEQLAREHDNFHYIITLSRPPEEWTGHRGYVQQRMAELLAARQDSGVGTMNAYICGLNDMVNVVREQLKSTYGWDRKQIIFERYD